MFSGFGVPPNVVLYQLHHSALQPGRNYLTSVCLSVFICGMGMLVSPTKVVVRIKYVNPCQTLRSMLGRYKHPVIVTLRLL